MICQETAFERAQVRIDIEREPGAVDDRFMATMSVIDTNSHVLHPLVFSDGSRVAISGASEAFALSSALTYLESRFGGYSETTFACVAPTMLSTVGMPVVVER
jgi:hypothetical protein